MHLIDVDCRCTLLPKPWMLLLVRKNVSCFVPKHSGMRLNKYKTFSVLIYSYINTSGIGKTRNCMETQFRVFPTSTSVDITIYQYGKNVLYFFYNIAMSKARRKRKISVFTSGGKFPVLTLSYINTALSQSAFRIYKCYIIMYILTPITAILNI